MGHCLPSLTGFFFLRVCVLQHNNTFHKGDKPFKCHMCGKRFQNAELFEQHQQKHAGDKPYKCPLCPKQFNHKTDLRRHMCLHTGQKPFMCQVRGPTLVPLGPHPHRGPPH